MTTILLYAAGCLLVLALCGILWTEITTRHQHEQRDDEWDGMMG